MSAAVNHRALLLLAAVLLPLLTLSAAARPCKTILFITTTTTADHRPNSDPAFTFRNLPIQNPHNKHLTFFFTTEIRHFRPHPRQFFVNDVVESQNVNHMNHMNLGHDFFLPEHVPIDSVKSSIRDRTLDIMSIVGALLFGVGCGALTAATMYLVWSVFSPRRFEEFSDDDEEDEVASAKKMGYVAVPAAKEVA